MKTQRLLIGLAALSIVLSSSVLADSIYKWTDDDGNVHYGDRPSGQPSEERLQITYARTDASAVQRRVQSHRESTASREEARSEAAAAEIAAAEERAEAEERMAKCEQTRAQLKQMLEARRVYREDENGERVYLDDQQRADARTRAEDLIEEHCG